MSQHDMNLADAAGAAFRSDVNSALAALVSNSSGATEPSTTYAYQWWADTTAGVLKQRNAANSAWIDKGPLAKAIGELFQTQLYQAFTTGGTSTAYTLTPVPAITSLIAGQRFNVQFNAANTTTSTTLAISGLTAKTLKVYDSTGAKVDPAIGALALNMLADVVYDGTDYVVLDQLPDATTVPPVRQTVLSGPIDSAGQSAFGGSTGAGTVTAAGTLFVTAANGFIASGQRNRSGSIVNPSWAGLTTNGTMYLYLDLSAGGVCTTGSGILAPTYQWGGADVVTANQFTFNIQEMVGKVGNGAAAVQTYRVYVGEVTVAGAVVTAITWYALMGRYDSGYTANLPTPFGPYPKSHNIGVVPRIYTMQAENTTAAASYSVGDVIQPFTGSTDLLPGLIVTKKTITIITSGSWYYLNASSGVLSGLTVTDWKWKLIADRGW